MDEQEKLYELLLQSNERASFDLAKIIAGGLETPAFQDFYMQLKRCCIYFKRDIGLQTVFGMLQHIKHNGITISPKMPDYTKVVFELATKIRFENTQALEECYQKGLLDSFTNVQKIEFFDLKNTDVQLPAYKYSQLTDLELKGSFKTLPENLDQFQQLKNLTIKSNATDFIIPSNLHTIKTLEHISINTFLISEGLEQLILLPYLRTLELATVLKDTTLAILEQLTQLSYLRLDACFVPYYYATNAQQYNANVLLDKLALLPNLKTLYLSNFTYWKAIPPFMANFQFLEHLTIENCTFFDTRSNDFNIQPFLPLQALTQLKTFKLGLYFYSYWTNNNYTNAIATFQQWLPNTQLDI